MEIPGKIIDYIFSCRYEDIPTEIIEEKKKNILDTMGVLIAGAGAPGCKTVIDELLSIGGRQDAAIFL